ncbi:MAG: FAD-dependent oxidoreductase [Flavobacteriales bacterium]|nr:FAD-dependent oxidoreductase [Flavobacteriales bacterium]
MQASSASNAAPTHATDVLIVGGGPGGCTAALQLARHGVRCTLIEKAVFPRDKVCGDALSGKVMRVLGRIDPGLVERVNANAHRMASWGSPSWPREAGRFACPSPATLAWASRQERSCRGWTSMRSSLTRCGAARPPASWKAHRPSPTRARAVAGRSSHAVPRDRPRSVAGSSSRRTVPTCTSRARWPACPWSRATTPPGYAPTTAASPTSTRTASSSCTS